MKNTCHHLLAIDVGNSRIKFGLFAVPQQGYDLKSLPQCLQSKAVEIHKEIPWNVLTSWTGTLTGGTTVCVIAGANPAGVERVRNGWPRKILPQPRVITTVSSMRLQVQVAEPDKVGIDRLLNGVAANLIREQDQSIIVVDSGTATTVDLIDTAGVFSGGAILPGVRLATRSLHDYTALLPQVTLDELAQEPVPAVGRNTFQAIRSGVFWGQLGSVKELIARISDTIPFSARSEPCDPDMTNRQPGTPSVVLTGGGGFLLAKHLPQTRFEPHLSLQGLALVMQEMLEQSDLK